MIFISFSFNYNIQMYIKSFSYNTVTHYKLKSVLQVSNGGTKDLNKQ